MRATFILLHLSAALTLFLACDGTPTANTTSDPTPDTTPAPVVFAGHDTLAQPGATLEFAGIATTHDTIVTCEWYFECNDSFTVFPSAAASHTLPAEEDSSYICIFRATDSKGQQGTDTLAIWVTSTGGLRVNRPDGGEAYRVGDTVHVVLWPVYGSAGLKLVIEDRMFNVPGLSSTFNPSEFPRHSFVVPESFSDQEYSPELDSIVTVTIPTVSNSCRIRVFDYYEPSIFDESDGFFAIVPADVP